MKRTGWYIKTSFSHVSYDVIGYGSYREGLFFSRVAWRMQGLHFIYRDVVENFTKRYFSVLTRIEMTF